LGSERGGFLKRAAPLRQMLIKYLKFEHTSSLATARAGINQLCPSDCKQLELRTYQPAQSKVL